MKFLAIIPARGGSKRIKNKNIKLFLDAPIISYSIQAAKDSEIFDDVIVSTNSEKIAEIAKKYGASVPFMRSEKNADDFATTTDVILEVIEQMKGIGKEYDMVCCIYPTAPFVTGEILHKAKEILKNTDTNSIFPITPFSFPPQRGVTIDEKGYLRFINKEHEFTRSQDLCRQYHDAGQFYFLKVEDFLIEKRLVLSKTTPLIVDELAVQDIDNETDWKLAELKFTLIKEEGVLQEL